jgi:phage-related minor tail protein
LTAGITDGASSMRQIFVSTLQRMASDLLSSQLLQVIQNLGKGTGGGGAFGLLKSIGGALVGAFGGGGLQEIDTSAFPQRRATGGPVSAGQTYLVGERGPELLQMKGAAGEIIPNHKIGGGVDASSYTVHNNVTINGQPDAATQLALKRALDENSRQTIAKIAELQRRGRVFA